MTAVEAVAGSAARKTRSAWPDIANVCRRVETRSAERTVAAMSAACAKGKRLNVWMECVSARRIARIWSVEGTVAGVFAANVSPSCLAWMPNASKAGVCPSFSRHIA